MSENIVIIVLLIIAAIDTRWGFTHETMFYQTLITVVGYFLYSIEKERKENEKPKNSSIFPELKKTPPMPPVKKKIPKYEPHIERSGFDSVGFYPGTLAEKLGNNYIADTPDEKIRNKVEPIIDFSGDGFFSALEVAEYVIWRCKKNSIKINNLKLSKILYYLQGHFLGKYGTPLFRGNIEAWKTGPIVPNAYFEYSMYGANELELPRNKSYPKFSGLKAYYIDENNRVFKTEAVDSLGHPTLDGIPEEMINFANDIIDRKSNLSLGEICTGSKNEPPWIGASNDGENARVGNIISLGMIYDFFKVLYKKG